jgi:ribonucleotide monophosphatase NagD (HAD superfamily)
MENLASAHHWLCDMDGVLINHGHIVPGADVFLDRLRAKQTGFLVLTNNALFTPRQIHDNKSSSGRPRWRRPNSFTISAPRDGHS